MVTLGSMQDDASCQDGEIDVQKVGPRGLGNKQLEMISAAVPKFLYKEEDTFYCIECIEFIVTNLDAFDKLQTASEVSTILSAFLKVPLTVFITCHGTLGRVISLCVALGDEV